MATSSDLVDRRPAKLADNAKAESRFSKVSNDEPLVALLEQLRRGEADAAYKIQERFGGQVRRLARVWLSQRRLGRLMDSEDICQSVLAEFFERYTQGSYELNNERQLRALLARIATSRLLYHWQRHRTAKRDMRRLAENATAEVQLEALATSKQPSPSQVFAGRELAEECRKRFSPAEWTIVELRNAGNEWKEISEQLGRSPDSLRMQYTRAVTRVARQLYLDGEAS
ncbi:MAG: RNA polymerase sigma factor [Aureliella sp.]